MFILRSHPLERISPRLDKFPSQPLEHLSAIPDGSQFPSLSRGVHQDPLLKSMSVMLIHMRSFNPVLDTFLSGCSSTLPLILRPRSQNSLVHCHYRSLIKILFLFTLVNLIGTITARLATAPTSALALRTKREREEEEEEEKKRPGQL